VFAGATTFALLSPILYLRDDFKALGSPQVAAARRAIGVIPEGVPVSATNGLGGYLSERRYIYTFPAVRQSRWIIADVTDTSLHVVGLKRRVRRYAEDKAWRIVFFSHGIVVLHKRVVAGG
jgi:hypothetical protein